MKKIDFTKEGGFPLKQDTLAFMQESYNELKKALLLWFGQSGINDVTGLALILSGLDERVTGGQWMITPGWIIRDGELLYFGGGPKNMVEEQGIGVQAISVPATYKSGSVYPVYESKYAVVGGVDAIALQQYSRIVNINDLRPILARSMVRNLEVLPPGGNRMMDLDLPGVNEGDVVVVSLSDNTGGSMEALYGSPEFVAVRAKVKADNKVSLFMINQHQTMSAFGGDIRIRIRVLK